MDIDSFIIHVKLEGISVGLVGGVKSRSDTCNYEVKRPLPIEKNTK